MADRSVLGWETVAEYEADPIASDLENGKKIRQAENRALTKQKSKKSNKLTFAFPVRNHQANSFRSTLKIMASHPQTNETSTDFDGTVFPRTTTFDMCNGLVAPMSDFGQCFGCGERWHWRKHCLISRYRN